MSLQELKIVLDWAKEKKEEYERLFTADPAPYRPRFLQWKEVYEKTQAKFDYECRKLYDKEINP